MKYNFLCISETLWLVPLIMSLIMLFKRELTAERRQEIRIGTQPLVHEGVPCFCFSRTAYCYKFHFQDVKLCIFWPETSLKRWNLLGVVLTTEFISCINGKATEEKGRGDSYVKNENSFKDVHVWMHIKLTPWCLTVHPLSPFSRPCQCCDCYTNTSKSRRGP